LNGGKKYLAIVDDQKKEVKNEILSLDYIFKHSELLNGIVDGYLK
jgi:hypothetical protein